MGLVVRRSLAETLDRITDVMFFGKKLGKAEKVEAARWIASRQGLPGSYANTFAPMEKDRREGARLFTGEKVRSGAATGHILGEEACRALVLLGVKEAGVRKALEEAAAGMMKRLMHPMNERAGMYCCGTCTPALWRNITSGGLPGLDREKWLRNGIRSLKAHRDGKGRWRRFPFYYTLLALTEIDLPSAVSEMRYAAPVLQRVVKKRGRKDAYAKRRQALAERVLSGI